MNLSDLLRDLHHYERNLPQYERLAAKGITVTTHAKAWKVVGFGAFSLVFAWRAMAHG